MTEDKVPIGKLYYDVIRKYQLPVLNHTILKSKIRALEEDVGYAHAKYYLEALLRRNLTTEAGDFKPKLNNSLDVYGKRLQIEDWFRKNKQPKTWKPPTEDELAQAEAKRLKQWED